MGYIDLSGKFKAMRNQYNIMAIVGNGYRAAKAADRGPPVRISGSPTGVSFVVPPIP